jgi:hypothetical protein
MTEAKTDFVGTHKSPYFKANLRLWSDSEPLTPVVKSSRRVWPHLDVKGEVIPARGRVKARIASKHYASSEDIKYEDIDEIVPVVSQWLSEIENESPPISALTKAGKVEALLWVAIFGYDAVAMPALPAELDRRANQAGVKILIENYTIMDEESGNPVKSFFGAKD